MASSSSEARAEFVSCTPHRPGVRFHVHYQDFLDLCELDVCLASALRAFEVKTNARIADLRRRYSIPDEMLPADEDLWINMSLRELETLTLHIQCKSSYAQAIAERAPQSASSPSLVELGLVALRYIARPGRAKVVALPATPTYVDEEGRFILVDREGCYVDDEGEVHDARAEGWTVFARQYLYLIDEVNTRLAALFGESPPVPVPRAEPVTVNRKPPAKARAGSGAQKKAPTRRNGQETTHKRLGRQEAGAPGAAIPSQGRDVSVDRGGTPATESAPSTGGIVASASNDITEGLHKARPAGESVMKVTEVVESSQPGTSRQVEAAGPARLRRSESSMTPAPGSGMPPEVEEALHLLAGILLPAQPGLRKPDRGSPAFKRDWEMPLRRLLARLSPLGWQETRRRLAQVAQYMTDPASPSWWQRPVEQGGREHHAPILPRHIEANFEMQYQDMQRRGWSPPLAYEVGYGGVSSEQTPGPDKEGASKIIEGSATVLPSQASPGPGEGAQRAQEEIPEVLGMPRRQAEELAAKILTDHPAIQPEQLGLDEIRPGWCVLGLEYAPDQWHRFEVAYDYWVPGEEGEAIIEQAERYGASFAQAMEYGQQIQAQTQEVL